MSGVGPSIFVILDPVFFSRHETIQRFHCIDPKRMHFGDFLAHEIQIRLSSVGTSIFSFLHPIIFTRYETVQQVDCSKMYPP